MSDSVGKISLDLEVQSDLQGQISKVSSNIAKGLKNSLQGATKGIFNGLENGIKKSTDKVSKTVSGTMKGIKNNIQSTFSSLKDIKIPSPKINFDKPKNQTAKTETTPGSKATRAPPINLDQIAAQISNTEKTLDNVNARIEQQKAKLQQLRESYNQAFEGTRKNRIEEQILKTEASINRLIGQSDKLGFKLADLDSKFAAMKSMQSNVSNATSNAANRINNLSNTSAKSAGVINKLSNSFKGLGNSSRGAGNGFRNANSSLGMFMDSMFKWGIVFPIIQQGIMSMASFLGSAFMANTQFANSLNLIRSNLYTAFAPIYNAVLPALNALMSALATVTAYIASFINNLFGSTYSAGFGAAQNLQNSIGAYEMQGKAAKQAATSLSGAGKAAKKAGKEAEKAIAPFDELNILNQKDTSSGDSGSPGSGVVSPITPMANMAPIEAATQEWAEKFKKLMSELLQPILAAWANEGENTINSIKYALSGVWELIKSIGASFKEVWLNGTGQYTCELILQILQNIFNIIGDIANALDNAWNKNNIGTQTVQNLWNSFNNLLYIIKGVGDVLRDVFQDIGQSVADHFMGVLNSLSGVLKRVTEDLKYIWDNGGSYCFGQLIEFGGRVFNVLADIVNNSLAPIASFIADTLTPVINALLNVVGFVFDKINSFLSWLDGTGNGILTGIVDVLLSFGTAWLVVQAGIKIFTGLQTVMMLVQNAAGLLSGAIAFLTSPLGIVTIAIGAVILIGYELYKHWEELKAKAIEVWNGIQAKFQEFKDWLGNVFATDWTQKFGMFGNILNSFLANVSNIFNAVKQIFSGIINFIAGVFTGNWSRAWSGVVSIFSGIMGSLSSVVKAPLNAVIGIINGAISGINSIHVSIPDWVPGLGGRSFGPHISRIPYLAKGGIVDQPTLAMVGEAGKEAVMPLENNTGWISNLAGQIASQLPQQGNTEGNKQPAQINIYLDGILSTQKFVDDINEMTRANGGVCPINI